MKVWSSTYKCMQAFAYSSPTFIPFRSDFYKSMPRFFDSDDALDELLFV
jgi:hypothetical protein